MDPRKTLLALQPGETGLVALLEENDFTSKLMALGILPNTRVKMVRKASFGKVFYVNLADHHIAIREAAANTVIREDVI